MVSMLLEFDFDFFNIYVLLLILNKSKNNFGSLKIVVPHIFIV